MEEELEKLYQDLFTNRQIYRGPGIVQARPPQPYQNLINTVNLDFTSLYPSIQKKYYYRSISMRVAIRKRKITNIFQ